MVSCQCAANQEGFTIPIEDISSKQLDSFDRKRIESLCSNESLVIQFRSSKVDLPGRTLLETRWEIAYSQLQKIHKFVSRKSLGMDFATFGTLSKRYLFCSF